MRPHDDPEDGDHERGRSGLRRLAPVLLACLVGLAGAWLGMALFGHETVPIGPFRVELDVGFGKGETELGLPPFGALTADTHLSPLHVSATLEDVGVRRLTDVVNQEGIDGLVNDVEVDAHASVRTMAWRILLVATLGGLALAAVVYRGRWRLVAAGGLTALLGVALCEVFLLATFTPEAFSEPTYSGSLALAPQLIGPVQDARGKIEDLRAGLEQIVDGTVRAYTTLQPTPLASDAIRVLHISDIHASPLGMEFAQEVARGFDVDFVIDTGDLTSFGTPIENLITTEIPAFGRPYVFIRGSHDSIELQAAVGQGAERDRPGRPRQDDRRPHGLRARPSRVHAGARRACGRRGLRGSRALGRPEVRAGRRGLAETRSRSWPSTTIGWPRTSRAGCRS